MFQKLKNLDSAFRTTRMVAISVSLGCLVLSGFVIYRSYLLATVTQNKIYVLVNGKALEALAGDRRDNIAVEARDHIRVFHEDFFTLDPDEQVIRTNITKALYLADASARREYENLKEKNFYAGIISANISQTISIDSIQLSTDHYPFYFRCFGRQKIIRESSIVLRSLITDGYIRYIQRSDNNPHGFQIERWAIIENKDLKIENRSYGIIQTP